MSALKTIIILGSLVFVAFVACLTLGYFGVSPFTAIYDFVADKFSTVDFSDPATLVTTGGAGLASAAAVAVPLLGKLSSAKDQITSTVSSAQTQINGLTTQLNSYKEQIDSTKQTYEQKIADLTKQAETATDYKTQLSTVQANFKNVELQKASIENELASLKAAYAKAQAQLEVLTPRVK